MPDDPSEAMAGRAAAAGAIGVIAAGALAPAPLQPLTTGFAALIAGIALAAWAAASGAPGRSPHAWTLPALLAPVIALGASAATSVDPGVALIGAFAQHSGWALWASLGLWAVGCLVATSRSGMLPTAAAGSLAGGALALFGLLDAAGIRFGAARYSADPSGLLDNPTSLAQLLVVTAACGVAWALAARTRPARATAIACAVLSVAGVLATRVTAGWVALAVGAAVMAALSRFRPATSRASMTAAAAVAASLPAALGLAALLVSGALGPAVTAAADSLATGRLGIWRAMLTRAWERPVLGVGPDLTTAVQSWSGTSGGELVLKGTTDPHGVMVSLLAGGGIVTLALSVVALGTFVFVLLEAHRRESLPAPASALVAGGAGLLTASLLAWLYAPAAFLAIAVTAPLVRDVRADAPASPRARLTATATVWLVTLGAAATLALWAAVPATLEIALLTGTSAPSASAEAAATQAYERWPDPQLATRALALRTERVLRRDDPAAPASLLQLSEAAAREGRWSVDVAFRRIVACQIAGAAGGTDTSDQLARAVADGRLADPGSGVWDYLLAVASAARGDARTAASAAKSALAFPQTPENRLWLESVAAGRIPAQRP